jgi:hypothetical protein
VNTKTDSERLTLRGYARHRGVAPSRIHRLVAEGVIPRGADGLIPTREADAILDVRAELVSPLVTAANAEMKRRRRARAGMTTPVPAEPDGDDEEHSDDEDEMRIDPDLADAMLAEQPNAHAVTPTKTPAERLAAAFELRLAHAQNNAIGMAHAELHAAAGDEKQLSIALGKLHGRLRAVVDVERASLLSAINALLDSSSLPLSEGALQ